MSNISNKSNHSNAAEKTKTQEATWPDFVVGLYDKLSGKGGQMTYEFDDLNVYVPSKLGEDADHFHWKMNGTIHISSQNEKNQEKDNA